MKPLTSLETSKRKKGRSKNKIEQQQLNLTLKIIAYLVLSFMLPFLTLIFVVTVAVGCLLCHDVVSNKNINSMN